MALFVDRNTNLTDQFLSASKYNKVVPRANCPSDSKSCNAVVPPQGSSSGFFTHQSCCFLCSASSCRRLSIFSCFFPSLRDREDTFRANSLCFSSFSLCLKIVKIKMGINILQISNRTIKPHLRSPSDLFMCVVIGVDVIVKLLVFLILLVTELTVEVGSQVFQRLGNGFLLFCIILQTRQYYEFL